MTRKLGSILTTVGGVLGAAGVVGLAAGFNIKIPPEWVSLMFYKLLFAAAIGLVVAGSLIGRAAWSRNQRDIRGSEYPRELSSASDPLQSRSADKKIDAPIEAPKNQ
jgi:hypothetical protein